MPKGTIPNKSSKKGARNIPQPADGEAGKSAVFVLSKMPDPIDLLQALPGFVLKVENPSPIRKFTILDCHDRSIQRSGRILLECTGNLHLYDVRSGVSSQRCKGQGKFLADLPDGPVKVALTGFPKLRALTPLGEGKLSRSDILVLDEVQKTQVRGSSLTLQTANGQAVLFRIEAMRGYERTFGRIRDALAGGETNVAAAAKFLFLDAQIYEAKPSVSLGKTEPAIDAAVDIIKTFLMVARQNESGIVADTDTEFLHDYRVSLRRVRSVLSLFKGVFSDAQTTLLKQEFSDLMAVTGRLRDLDVYLLEKDKFYNLVPSDLHSGLTQLFNRFEAERKREHSRLSRYLCQADYDARMQHLEFLFQDCTNLEPGPNAKLGAYDYARTLIWKRYRKVCKLARGITPTTPDEAVHDLRIHCKKLRYLMEFFGPLFDKTAFKTIIKPLKRLQDNLGLFNDCSVQQAALLDFVAQQTSRTGQANAELSMSVGGLIAVLDQKQKHERTRVIANFQHFDSAEVRRLSRSLFQDAKE